MPRLSELEALHKDYPAPAKLERLGLSRFHALDEARSTFSLELTAKRCEKLFGPIAFPAPSEGGGCRFQFSRSAEGIYELSLISVRLQVDDRLAALQQYLNKLGQPYRKTDRRVVWTKHIENFAYRIEYIIDNRAEVYRIELSSEDMRTGARRRALRNLRTAIAANPALPVEKDLLPARF